MSTVTSFKKKSSSKPSHPHGTRPSFHNSQLLVSTGVPSMDPLLGGGICVGSILLLEEDQFEHYSRILLKYFIAEGVMCGHSVILGGANESSINIINELPAAVVEDHNQSSMPSLVEDEEETSDSIPAESEDMRIAWRYKNKPMVQSSFSNKFGHNFDLTKKMDKERIEKVNKYVYAPSRNLRTADSAYAELIEFIRDSLKNNPSHILSETAHNQQPATIHNVIHRIAISSLGSPLWLQDTTGTATDLTSFLHTLRGIVREFNAVAMVTIPTHLFQDSTTVHRLERLCDSVVRTESFEGSDKELNPLYKDYHGLFHLVKLPRVNTLTAHYPDTLDLTFKLKRKRFVIEKLHLPPELSNTVNRTQEDPVQAIKKGSKTKTQLPSSSSGGKKVVLTSKVQDEF